MDVMGDFRLVSLKKTRYAEVPQYTLNGTGGRIRIDSVQALGALNIGVDAWMGIAQLI